MNHQKITRALFLSGMVFASGAFAASSDVKKCITESGHVTLTDELCPSGSTTVKIISGPATYAAPAARPAPVEPYAGVRVPARYAGLMKSTAPAGGLPLDVTTLRAARANLQMFDNATRSLRAQRVAGLQ